MAQVYTFIATKTTYATTIPVYVEGLAELTRRVRNALSATDYPIRVGELRDYPLAVAVPNFLLCDGSELLKLAFPELAEYLTGDPAYQAADAANFLLPNYLGTKTQSPTAPPQTIEGGAVIIGDAPSTSEPAPGGTGGTTGAGSVSGGRPPDQLDRLPD